MKAVRFSDYGGPEVLRLVETEAPHAGPGQVRIAVRAATDPAWILAVAAELCAEGLFRLSVERTFPLDRVAEAQEVSARGHVTGKLVICVAQGPIA